MGVRESVDKNVSTVIRRAPQWSIGLSLFAGVLFLGAWFFRETFTAIWTNETEIRELQQEIRHCKEIHSVQAQSLYDLRQENLALRDRVARLEKTVSSNP